MRWLAILALGGCGTLADGDYAGERLLRLRGMPRAAPEVTTTAGVGAAALWQSARITGADRLTRMPLAADFPAFWIDVVAWPPAAVLLQLGDGEPAFAEGYLHVVRPDLGAEPGAGDFLATDYDHVLVYVRDPIEPGGPTARYLGAPYAPGFHVATRASTAAPSAGQAVLIERCVALAVDVPAARARDTCTALHLYQLAPAPDDLDTILGFDVEGPRP